jgi:hypothetical protein
MSEIVPFGHGLARGESRALGRDMARLRAHGSFELARIDQAAMLQSAQAEGLAEVAVSAMDSVARVSLRGDQLTQLVPTAAGRLGAIVDALTIAEIGLVHQAARRMR